MLIEGMEFNELEVFLKEEGEIETFEKESGKILGRAMITFGEVPKELKNDVLKDCDEEDVYVFNCSFDFLDFYLGAALDKQSLKFVSNVWVTEQVEGASKGDQDWIEFFVRMLAHYVITDHDTIVVPLYIFLNDEAEMVIEPMRSND